MIHYCLPGASQAVNWSFPAFLVPPWCLAGYPIGPILDGRLNFSTTVIANGPVRGKSWGGLHGWLAVAQTGL